MKCKIVDIISDWGEYITMEDWFRNGIVMKGMDDYFIGTIVSSETLVGYVEEVDSLL